MKNQRVKLAGMAMQGLLSNPIYHNPNEKEKMITVQALAETALSYADAVLDQIYKGPDIGTPK